MQEQSLTPKIKEKHDIRLLEGEKVLYFNLFTISHRFISFFFYAVLSILMFSIFLWASGTSSVIFTFVLGIAFIAFASTSNQSTHFHLITSEGIRMKEGLIYWNAVQEIKTTEKGRNRKIVLELIDSFASEAEVDSLFIQGDYVARDLYLKILPYWKSNSPKIQLRQLADQLAETYQLSVDKKENEHVKMEGMINQFALSIQYGAAFPFQSFQVNILLPKEIASHLEIENQKKDFYKNEFKSGIPAIDNNHYIKGIPSTLIQRLLTEETGKELEKLQALGKVKWTFGKQNKLKKAFSRKEINSDNEAVLDSLLLPSTDRASDQIKWDNQTDNHLRFKGVILPELKNNPQKAIAFIKLGVRLSVQFAECLMEEK